MMINKIKKSKVVSLLTSIKFTVIGLLLLLFLTIAGTLYQVNYGLYEAKIHFFTSWFYLVYNFIPIPGGKLVLFGLCINLVCVMLFKLKYKWRNTGLILMHFGLIVILFGSFMTHYFAKESYMFLQEGQTLNYSEDNNKWELVIWAKTDDNRRDVYTISEQQLKKDENIKIDELNFSISIKDYFTNSMQVNRTTISKLKSSPNPSQNYPGIIGVINSGNETKEISFSGKRVMPFVVSQTNRQIAVRLRRKRYKLPISIKLLDFVKTDHPGTMMAKSFESSVEVKSETGTRIFKIFMNNPLSYENFTFFQSSYVQNPDGSECSVLAVVENAGKFLPYISSIIIFVGFLFHFIYMLIRFVKKQEK